MIVLGVHFGHDASVAVVADGRLACCIQGERHSRVKHGFPATFEMVLLALRDAGLSVADVDLAAVTSTQFIPFVLADTRLLDLDYAPDLAGPLRCGLSAADVGRLCRANADTVFSPRSRAYLDLVDPRGQYHPEVAIDLDLARHPTQKLLGANEIFDAQAWWQDLTTLDAVRRFDASGLLTGDGLSRRFHLPGLLRIGGRSIPAAIVSHHMAHAASAFYLSEFARAGVMTYDGTGDRGSWAGTRGGMYYLGEANRVWPIVPHYLSAAPLYSWVANRMFGSNQYCGKVMGLAPYGSPAFYDETFVGTYFEPPRLDLEKSADAWLAFCLDRAAEAGYDTSGFGDADRILEPINTDIAASTQAVFEATSSAAAGALHAMLTASGKATDALCLAGGGALNCPTNSRLWRDGPFREVFVPPPCDDGGLAIGAALHLAHNLFDLPRRPAEAASSLAAHVGRTYSEADIKRAVAALAADFRVETADPLGMAAERLAANGIIGIFEGRSEMGPRALGHRSILADPRDPANKARVNAVKHREVWRPFAPAVLADRQTDWFADCPANSPFMLFNARVISDRVPAITHVDGSARVQTVSPTDGLFHDLIAAFDRLTGVPVVLNTSLNGPGEPLCETPGDAAAFFRRSALDGFLFGRRWFVYR